MAAILATTNVDKITDVNTLTAAEMEDMCTGYVAPEVDAKLDKNDEIENQLEELYRAYDEILQKEADENPPQIGYCGFPCDGCCSECGGNSGFDITDEV